MNFKSFQQMNKNFQNRPFHFVDRQSHHHIAYCGVLPIVLNMLDHLWWKIPYLFAIVPVIFFYFLMICKGIKAILT